MMREQQLQELLARESELTPAQREELLRQLAAWPGVASPSMSLVCSQDSDSDSRYFNKILSFIKASFL